MVAQPPPHAARIRHLEQTIRTTGIPAANNLVPLLRLITPDTPHTNQAIHATRRALKHLSPSTEPPHDENTLSKWIQARRAEYTRRLLAVLNHAHDGTSQRNKRADDSDGEDGDGDKDGDAEDGEAATAVAAAALTHAECWQGVVRGVVDGSCEGARGLVVDFVARFVDLRLEAMDVVRLCAGSVKRRMWLLGCCAGEGLGMEVARAGGEVVRAREVRRRFAAAWVAVLEDEGMGREERREALERVGREVIRGVPDPLKLADFLVGAYNEGGDVEMRVAALDGLFVLISEYGLDYPLFYHKLYGMMSVEALFYARGRARFLALMGMVLKRDVMLPGGMVAAFVKRLVRRALVGPPEGVLWCLRLALDLLVRHPNVSYLVHRAVNLFDDVAPPESAGDKRKRDKGMDDPYDDDELDPQESRAHESCLWELEILARHVSPAVSRLVTLFSRDVRERKRAPAPGVLEDYADLKFSDTFAAEFKRRAKSSHLAYDPPGSAPGLQSIREKLEQCIEWT